ncbi:MAG: DEAD/DEAH box helicase [Spirochaetales bacterium]
MNFTELKLHPDLMVGLAKAGYETCTPVQEQVLTQSLEGRDVYVQSQTGTGKTAAFLTTIIQQLLTSEDLKGKKALIMVPTRELAVQVEQEAKTLLTGTSLSCASFYGGVGYNQQTAVLKKGVDILIGTPGRVLDLQKSTVMDLSHVGFLVLDEADRMFDMGFYPDLRRLIKVLPDCKNRKTMLFSATLNAYVKNLAWEYTENALEITVEAQNITVDEIDQMLFHVSSDEKMKLLLGILADEQCQSCIVFCNTKRSCEVVAKRLKLNGYTCEFIIGDLPQSKRLQVMNSFKNGKLHCLVATDVAARGIDVDDLALVVNFDLPNEAENYVHRIGRTARAGRSGKAYTFCSEQDVYALPAIERYIGNAIPATMPDAHMLVADKSAGVYIKTDNYGDRPYDDKKPYDKKSSGTRAKSFDKRQRGERTASSYANKPKKNYENPTRQPKRNTVSDKDISKLSFEERMAFYKEKYGSTEDSAKNTRHKKTHHTHKKQGEYKNTKNNYKKQYENKQKPGAREQKAQPPAKKGFFSAIKGLFSRK